MYENKNIQNDREYRRDGFRKVASRDEASRKQRESEAQQSAKVKPITEKYSRTNGYGVTASVKAGAGVDITAGIVDSKTDAGTVKKCGLVSFCPAAGPIVQATGGIHKIFSAGEFNSGVSASACSTGTIAAGVDGAVSNCTTFYDSSTMSKTNLGFKNGNELFDSSNQTTTIGGVFGASAGVNAALCPQITICSALK
ncbi:hypothetical protein [Acinetobacter sp. ESBL14]|uniref:hypothetical protein n=1 Tax=Acinetobacter sp. ESBL14 TaxID=3077329 RepID=UPI002FC915F8